MAELWTVNSRLVIRLLMAILAATLMPNSIGGVAADFEAAFQGECREDSPCQHSCFDLHDGTFECSCKEGYTLAVNGYSCIENSKLNERKEWNETSSSWQDNGTLPEELSDAEFSNQIQTSQSSKRATSKDSPLSNEIDQHDYRGVVVEHDIQNLVHKNRKKSNVYDDAEDESLSEEYSNLQLHDVKMRQPTMRSVETLFVSTPSVKQKFSSCSDILCEGGGICISDTLNKNSVRCRCPLGRRGDFCEQAFDAKYPRFRDGSYLVLPVLRDAHKSMQVTMEFRPESNTGILLYTGEKLDLQEDFISITMRDGFVEFRFDCGMGEGLLISDQPIVLYSWNTLTIYRDRWDAWMQLNSGSQVQGRSKGLFSRITFRLSLYIGGSPNISLVTERTFVNTSFKGCIRHLAINREVYNFRLMDKGDAIEGADIDECTADVCSSVTCYNGGQCVASSLTEGICLCPLGYIGDQCESAMDLIVPLFNGSSYLQFPGFGNTALSFIELEIVFKPYRPNGVLLYNGYKMDGTGDFISINLVNGFVEFRFDLGTGVAVIRSREPVSMGAWHTAFISRTGRVAMMQVDQQSKVEGTAGGAFTQLSLPLNLYIGGVHDFRDISRLSAITVSFIGCVQKVILNGRSLNLFEDSLSGINVANCLHACVERPCENGGQCEPIMDYYTCHCHLGYAGNNCGKEVTEMIAEPMFTGASYLHYLDENIVKRIRGNKFDMRLKFRSFGPSGLLLWAGKKEKSTSSDHLSLGLREGFLHFQYNLGSGQVDIVYNHTKVDDGKWHFLHVTRIEQMGSVVIDNGPAVTGKSPGPMNQLNINHGLYLGGMESIASQSLNRYHSGLVGCLANLTLSTDYHIRLITHATTGINIQPCL